MRVIFRPFRLLGVAIVVATFLFVMSLVWLVIRDKWKYTRAANHILSRWCRFACFVLSVRPRVIGSEHLRDLNGALLVGNHLTYVDVLVIASFVPACFVTSTEIKRSLGLGQICVMAGCLFVDRKNKRNIVNEVSEIQEGLQKGLNVAIFPEATSTNGEAVLKFRKPLYSAAVMSGAQVVPFVLNYKTVGDVPVTKETRDDIFWYGDMDFIPHIWRLTGRGGAEVNLHILPPIRVSASTDTASLTEETHRLVAATFVAVT
jgi:lyso-ornithine lipid O-acyltransferase